MSACNIFFVYQEKGGVFSGMFKKSPKMSEGPRLEEVMFFITFEVFCISSLALIMFFISK